MGFKFNPLTGQLDLVGTTGTGSGDVTGPSSSTDNAITRYDGITGKLIQNSSAILDDSGGITTQAFVFNRQILADITVPDKHVIIAREVELISGDIILNGDAEIVII